jgi:putative transposase
VTPSSKFEIISETVRHENNMLSVSYMCEVAGVSRSGYYEWEKAADARKLREEMDRIAFEQIRTAYQYRGYQKGARQIQMRLQHMEIVMNLKKIRRLMKKYGLVCPIRRANPYRRMANAIKTNAVFPNIVNREFTASGPRKILLTDITYIFYKGGVCYLSTIIDAFTREILAYELSKNLAVTFVINTVNDLVEKYGSELDDTTIIHSDQGCHYTSKAFIQKLKDNDFVQSMSRKGNCWDNAPQESFFGHMKDEIKGEIACMKSFDEVKAKIDDWMDYYNHDRYQVELKKLSPCEYYTYITTGESPIPVV